LSSHASNIKPGERMKNLLLPLKHFSTGMYVAAGILLVMVFGPTAIQLLQTQYWPVLYDWHPKVTVRDGDIVVSGTVRKRNLPNCEYVPPQRVIDLDTGEHLVLVSLAPTAGQNWIGSGQPRAFGPWVVYQGAGRRLQFYSEHKCGPSLRSFSILGVVDTRASQ